MEEQIEFSQFFILLNSVKEGDLEDVGKLNKILDEFKQGASAQGPLHEMGQLFISIGIDKLYGYTGINDINAIGNLDQLYWEELEDTNKIDLPQYLAKEMTKYAKENSSSKSISSKWNSPQRIIDKNFVKMSRYITEGIIDAID